MGRSDRCSPIAPPDFEPGRRRVGLRRRLAAPLVATLLALLPPAISASPAQAACSAVFTAATEVTFICGNADDEIRFDVSGSVLRHNRASAGDGGFVDDEDFSTFAAGQQTLTNSPFNRVTVLAGTGNQHVILGSTAAPAGGIQARFTLDASLGTDRLTVDDSGNASVQQPIELTDTGVTLGAFSATYSGASRVTILAGGGDDPIRVTSTAAGTAAVLDAGGGGHQISVAATGLNSSLEIRGGADNDAVTIGPAGTLDNIRGTVTVIAGSGPADVLNISDVAQTAGSTYTATKAGNASMTTIQRPGIGQVSWEDSFDTIALTTGTGDDRVIWDRLERSFAPVSVDLGRGTDTFEYRTSTGGESVIVQECAGRVSVGQECTNSLNRVSLVSAEQAIVDGGRARDVVTVAPPAGLALTVRGGDGNDSFGVESIAPGATVTLDGGAGDDEFSVGGSILGRIGSAQAIRAALPIDGGPGTNTLRVRPGDGGVPSPAPPGGASTVAVTPTSVGAGSGDNYFGAGGSVGYQNMTRLSLNGHDVDDTVRVTPSATTEYSLFGLRETTADTLDLDLTGATGAILELDSNRGELRFGNRRPVTFTDFETRLAGGQPIAGLLELAAAEFTADENGGQAAITVTRTSALGAASVQLATSNGTATGGVDYAPATVTVQFARGETSRTVTLAVLDDGLVEGEETVNLTLSSVIGLIGEAAPGPRTTAVLRIGDDDAPGPGGPGPGPEGPGPRPEGPGPGPGGPGPGGAAPRRVAIADARRVEANAGVANLVFNVRLSAPSTRPVSVRYATQSVTAQANRDFVPRTGSLTIPAGRTVGTIAVPIRGDTLREADERFRVVLSGPTDATLVRNVGVGTILDDDGPPRLYVDDAERAEGRAGRRPLAFTVGLTRPSAAPVTVRFATANGTARSGADYVAARGTLTFPPGVTRRTIAVPLLGDRTAEPDEQLRVTLSGASVALADNVGVGTIVNDD